MHKRESSAHILGEGLLGFDLGFASRIKEVHKREG